VIIVTGFDQAGMREKCLKAGASVYLVKPIDSAEMASAIDVAIAARR
jgi:AmiR/NasT family two-component response regulator